MNAHTFRIVPTVALLLAIGLSWAGDAHGERPGRRFQSRLGNVWGMSGRAYATEFDTTPDVRFATDEMQEAEERAVEGVEVAEANATAEALGGGRLASRSSGSWRADNEEDLGASVVGYDRSLRSASRTTAGLFEEDYVFVDDEPWTWQILPEGLIFKPFLADTKASRFAAHIINLQGQGWMWEGVLGTQVGLLRYGNNDPIRPVGFQVDAEGSASVRLDIPDDVDVTSVDFRGGIPVTFGWGRHRTRIGYYHLSSHLGDEFLIKNPGFNRLNYARDVLYLGHAVFLTPKLRVYGQVGWAFYTDVAEEWEFQVGLEYAPVGPTGIYGAPFFAINGDSRQEVNFGGSLTVEAGWAWVGETGRMLRTGLLYFNGESNQYSFYDEFEQQIGFGLWYDF